MTAPRVLGIWTDSALIPSLVEGIWVEDPLLRYYATADLLETALHAGEIDGALLDGPVHWEMRFCHLPESFVFQKPVAASSLKACWYAQVGSLPSAPTPSLLDRDLDPDSVVLGPFVFQPLRRLLLGPLKNFSEEALPLSTPGDTPVGTLILREKESAFLEFLLQQPHYAASRVDLLAHVWGYGPDAQTRTLETHVYQLRQKMEHDPKNPQLIVSTLEGYRLNLSI